MRFTFVCDSHSYRHSDQKEKEGKREMYNFTSRFKFINKKNCRYCRCKEKMFSFVKEEKNARKKTKRLTN